MMCRPSTNCSRSLAAMTLSTIAVPPLLSMRFHGTRDGLQISGGPGDRPSIFEKGKTTI